MPEAASIVYCRQKTVVRTADDAARTKSQAEGATFGGARSYHVPMLKESALIGAITIYRQEVRPFTDKQVELVQTSRPRPSSQSRTRGCSTNCASPGAADGDGRCAARHQFSPGELEPVFQAMLQNATRICEAKIGNLLLLTEGTCAFVATS